MASTSSLSESMSAKKASQNSRLPLAGPRKSRRESQDSAAIDITPTTSVPSTPKSRQIDEYYSHKQSKEATTSSNIATNGSTTFAEGKDFMPFVISDPSDDEPGLSRRRTTNRTKVRHRETEKKSDRDATAGHQLSERQAMSDSDSNEVSSPDHVQGKSKMSGSERGWNRGKEVAVDDRYDRKNGRGRDRKRKYDEYDHEYSNQKQRMEVGSRTCPWVAGLDLNRCSNVAEMWVEWCSCFRIL